MTGSSGGGRRSRRVFLQGVAATTAVIAWSPAFRVATASAEVPALPAGLPPGMDCHRQAFRNWSNEIVVDQVWTAVPRHARDLTAIADWAVEHGFRVRARGAMHSFSPITIMPGQDPAGVLLVDTTEHLTRVRVSRRERTVTAQPGVRMEALLSALQARGLGLANAPAVGEITLGGALAIDGHGTSVPASGEQPVAGQTYGSLSNLVTSVTAVAWAPERRRYELRRFDRGDEGTGPLLAHLGRALVAEVTLRVAPAQRLRCQSFVDVPADELLADPATATGRTFASYLDDHGRAEIIWFPFTDRPWLKVWSVAPRRPRGSRMVTGPYNYVFADSIPTQLSDIVGQVVRDGRATPAFCRAVAVATAAGLRATRSSDLWGWAKDVQLYAKPTTLRYGIDGYVVLARRADVQQVVHDLCAKHRALVEEAHERGEHPVNGPIEIRVTGLDRPEDCEVPHAATPSLSALRPRPDRPEWDTAVWFNALTFPGTPGSLDFFAELERWIFDHFDGSWAAARVEWSKGFAYTGAGAHTDDGVLQATIPAAFPSGPGRADGWDAARDRLHELDPHGTFGNPFLDRLLS
jgi:FAD/FMN-containing dehydrogenase